MRLVWLAVTAVAVGAVSACDGPPSTEPSPAPVAVTQEPWVVVAPGKATPGPGVKKGGSPRPGLPPVSFLPTGTAGCTVPWPQSGLVLIPMVVTPVAGGFKVDWPASYGK